MSYYTEIQYIPRVDKHGSVLGKIERWEAHKKGVLHSGFTICLEYDGKYILQHRKHPVFDGVFDCTCSSHLLFEHDHVESEESAIYRTLLRELGVKKKDLKHKPKRLSTAYYKANDTQGTYVEHEYCTFYHAELATLPLLDYNYGYGLVIVEKEKLTDPKFPLRKACAPWVKKFLQQLIRE